MIPFNHWLQQMWLEHIDEVLSWTGRLPTYTSKDYFNTYKWWLRREFQHRVNKVK